MAFMSGCKKDEKITWHTQTYKHTNTVSLPLPPSYTASPLASLSSHKSHSIKQHAYMYVQVYIISRYFFHPRIILYPNKTIHMLKSIHLSASASHRYTTGLTAPLCRVVLMVLSGNHKCEKFANYRNCLNASYGNAPDKY